ncbi:hypothetical protein [Emcibacter sp.]|uniref:hypothetical protein n=1 Tax=Emcibacter sp. TaxID=1979954 RepID=UPI003A9364D9
MGADILRMLEIRQMELLSLGELWSLFNEGTLMTLEEQVTSGRFPGVWQDVMMPVLAVPAAIFLIVVGGLMLFSFRHRYLG